jgi:NADPH:quinone reductase-like Zn-dependent oxidoreductase
MRAAVVRSFDHPPRFEAFELPKAEGPHAAIVDVLAAGLHPRVRSSAAGTHYADSNVLPMVPGIDGVGRLPDGRRVYFVLHDTALGSLAEQTIVDTRRCVPVPDGVDAALVAAAMNPAMSSWLALRLRAPLKAGAQVLVLGVTGNAGQMAVQVARRLGASRVIGAGRDAARLQASKAHELISLVGEADSMERAIASAAAEVDVVIDYLWGEPAERAMVAIVKARGDRSRPLDWIQVGSVAGPTMALPSVALRSANLRVVGSGQGSVSLREIVAELPALMKELADGALAIEVTRVPLSQVESIWLTPAPAGKRVVFFPNTDTV